MRSHLICSEMQLIEGQNYVAVCGEEVKNAVWVYTFNTETNHEFLAALSPAKTCEDCYRCELSDGYVYGMVSREDIENEEPAPAEKKMPASVLELNPCPECGEWLAYHNHAEWCRRGAEYRPRLSFLDLEELL